MKYVVDVLENTLNEEEANKYYEKSITEMEEIERKVYLQNELKYISFFHSLFENNNKKMIIKINNFCNSDIDEFFEEERLYFINELKKLNIKDILLKNEITIKNFNDVMYLIKLSYRDFTSGYNKLELKYNDIGIEVSSNSDYIYILNQSRDSKLDISRIAKKNSIFLKKISDHLD